MKILSLILALPWCTPKPMEFPKKHTYIVEGKTFVIFC
jgi:hypothetical protein